MISIIAWEKHGKTHDQEGGSAIIMPWEMAQVQNMNHACN
jgi:hypothetical protein